jgi:hypothetical protein
VPFAPARTDQTGGGRRVVTTTRLLSSLVSSQLFILIIVVSHARFRRRRAHGRVTWTWTFLAFSSKYSVYIRTRKRKWQEGDGNLVNSTFGSQYWDIVTPIRAKKENALAVASRAGRPERLTLAAVAPSSRRAAA